MNRKVLLIEPDYKNKYPPMGLMKMATYFRRCGDDVRFFKGNLKDLAAQLLCEEYLEENSLIGVHPNDNTATIWLKAKDLIDIIKEHGNDVNPVSI